MGTLDAESIKQQSGRGRLVAARLGYLAKGDCVVGALALLFVCNESGVSSPADAGPIEG